MYTFYVYHVQHHRPRLAHFLEPPFAALLTLVETSFASSLSSRARLLIPSAFASGMPGYVPIGHIPSTKAFPRADRLRTRPCAVGSRGRHPGDIEGVHSGELV